MAPLISNISEIISFLDTQAEIEWLMGDNISAINSIKKAIAIDSENNYYLSQLKKFEQ